MRKLRSNANERQLKLAGKIVAAYLMRNVVSIDDLPHVIQQTHAALRSASPIFQSKEEPIVGKRRPAVPIRKSVAEHPLPLLSERDGRYGGEQRTGPPRQGTEQRRLSRRHLPVSRRARERRTGLL
ncbi:MucR family transcriptional regulator [Sinorhizobium saheli]|uniref:MucR family transcriptional regulator n=1 Tax=Sinorhizobium saheli TaxID=36856 RepID=UPI0012974ED7|nr:hypothetical protein [Sinorhizobium saheli]